MTRQESNEEGRVISSDDNFVTRRELDLRADAHQREHDIHEKAHELEHAMSSDALVKADLGLERRLEGMNEFRAQLDRQAATYLTRETFDAYVKEENTKREVALVAASEKYDTIIKAIVSRHDADTDELHTANTELKDQLRTEIQNEREHRKIFEGSINTWKWIATFLGASGLAGVVYMLATGNPN